jgi:DNA helicase-2/ATP-dependent DNA helicase PcrA
VSSILDKLNDAQRAAAQHISGASLVIAGAGSGKTRVITSRIAYLIAEQNVQPYHIVALTFTNKAAREMKERIALMLESGEPRSMPFIGTFHAYCLMLIRKYKALLGLEQFSIMDADDQRAVIKRLIKQHSMERYFTPSQAVAQISHFKNASSATKPPVRIRELTHAYEQEKAASHTLDFDDILLVVHDKLASSTEFRERIQNSLKHLLVDEYQDTNTTQHALLKFLAKNADGDFSVDSICAVGDEDQSIYSWRGALVENMQHFIKDFAPTKVFKVEQNYRSVQPILEAANHVISHNRSRTEKKLWSEKKAHNRVSVISCPSGRQEAEIICEYISRTDESVARSNIAILYRTHAQSRLLEEACIKHGIGYKIVGGIRFYERKEIKDLLSLMRLVHNPYDRTSLLRMLNTPTRGLGTKAATVIMEAWNRAPDVPFYVILRQLCDEPSALNKTHKQGLEDFLSIFDGIDDNSCPTQILRRVIDGCQYMEYLTEEYEPLEARTKQDNVREFMTSVEAFIESYDPEEGDTATPLASFLHEIALLQEQLDATDDDSQKNLVNLMTLHSAKGLEFDFVMIAGCEEGSFPSSRSEDPKDIEEERRLFYVGITRARSYLAIFHAERRSIYGQVSDQLPSRFLSELPNKLVQEFDFGSMTYFEQLRTISRWLGTAEPTGGINLFGGPPAHLPSSRPNPKPDADIKSTRGVLDQLKKVSHKPFNRKPATNDASRSPWYPGKMVRHPKFGQGKVLSSEHRSGNEYFVTVRFAVGTKRIASSFFE